MEENNIDTQSEQFINDIIDDFATPPTETTAAPEEASQEDIPVQADAIQEEAAPEPKEQLSPILAEKAKIEREMRAKLEASEQAQAVAVEEARKEVLAELMSNPSAFINKYGIENPGDLALHFYAADLGDEAPDDLKAQVGMSELEQYKRSVEQRFKALEEEKAQAAENARNKAILDQYNGFLASVPGDMPYFAAEVGANQQEALMTMAEVADHMAQNGQYPSASEVAQLIERQLAETAQRYANINKPKVIEQKAVPAKKETVTLSNENSGSSGKALPTGEDEIFNDVLDYFNKNFR